MFENITKSVDANLEPLEFTWKCALRFSWRVRIGGYLNCARGKLKVYEGD